MTNPSLSDKKFLSVFTERFIPSWWRKEYPLFMDFLRQCLEWMEQTEHVYDNIANFDRYVDIDKIAAMKNSPDPAIQELGNTLIDQVYKQYLGDTNARYLSTLMDEILFIKNQKNILKYKGTTYSFLFFFLLIMGGYFRVYTILGKLKKHDGTFSYNGVIYYGNGVDWVEPFVYLIKSEYDPVLYKKIVDVLNPAGMFPVRVQNTTRNITVADTIENAITYGNIYFAFYQDAAFIGLVAASSNLSEQVSPSIDDYDVEFTDSTFWKYVTSISTGINHMAYEANFNTYFFSTTPTYFNKVYVLRNVYIGATPATSAFYFTAPTSSTTVAGPITLLHGDATPFKVISNTGVGIMAEFT